jgi:hypothetical protein
MKKYILLAGLQIIVIGLFAQKASDSSANSGLKKAPWFVERFRVGVGFFGPSNNTAVRLGASNGLIGTNIDFENDLGFERTTNTFAAHLQWRSSRRSRFDLEYYQLNRSSSKSLQRTIQFGDDIYNINANVKAFFNNSVYRFSYGYAIISKPKVELGLQLGIHTMQSSMGIALAAGGVGASASEDFGFTAPLPNLGIWGGYALSKRFALKGDFSYLSLNTGEVNGKIVSYQAALMYRILPKFDITAGYSGFNFEIDATVDKQNAGITWGYNGPSLTLNYSFGKKRWAN